MIKLTTEQQKVFNNYKKSHPKVSDEKIISVLIQSGQITLTQDQKNSILTSQNNKFNDYNSGLKLEKTTTPSNNGEKVVFLQSGRKVVVTKTKDGKDVYKYYAADGKQLAPDYFKKQEGTIRISADGTSYTATKDGKTVTKKTKDPLTAKLDQEQAKLNKTKKEQGILGKGWDWFKNKTGIGDGSDKAQKQIDKERALVQQVKSGKVDAKKFKEVTGVEYTKENAEKFKTGNLELQSTAKVNGYAEGQEMAVDMAGDIVSGIAAMGVYTVAVAAAPFTGGASIAAGFALATVAGGAIKCGVKAIDKGYCTKKDFITGAFSGALAPLTGGLGGAVGKSVAKATGIQAVKAIAKEGAEQTVKTGAKSWLKTALINPAGYEYGIEIAGKEGLKMGWKGVAALGIEMATDGALGGAIDTAFRTGYEQVESGEGLDWGVIGESALQGGIGGAIMSPIIGGGMKATGKAGHSLGSYFGFNKSSQLVPTEKISKNLTEATGVVSSVKINELASSGIKLKYGRDEFAGKLKEIVNHLPIEKQEEILSKFNIKLIYTADNSFQIKDIPTIPTGKIKDKTELSIKKEIQKFIKENEFVSGNTELDKFLNDFTKNVPEFFYTIGKKQHETHELTVDVHTLSVLKKSIENPEYSKLADEDKVVLNFAIMLHDLTKEFVDVKTPDRNHA